MNILTIKDVIRKEIKLNETMLYMRSNSNCGTNGTIKQSKGNSKRVFREL